MKYKKLAMLVFFLVFAILIIHKVDAIGVTPGRTTIDFEPDLSQDIKFTVINNEQKDMKAVLRIEGDLAQYIKVSQALINFKAEEDSKELTYRVNLPKDISKKGINKGSIIIMELPEEVDQPGAFVGATAAVATELIVRVPYPGKYAEIDLAVSGEGPVYFHIPISNFGEQDIIRAGATIDILGSNNEKIVTIETEEKSIKSKERDEIVAEWKAENINPGTYHAIVTLTYDGKIAVIEKNFNVGQLRIDVESITVNNYQLGGIAKFLILVNSKWNEVINDVYVQMIINDDQGKEIANFKTASDNVDPLSKKELIAYWDTEGIKEGKYNGKIFLHYEGITTEKEIETDIRLDSLTTNILGTTGRVISSGVGTTNTNTLLIILVVVLVVINAGWFLYFRKKKKNIE
ncbi:hypothetical protein K8R47_02990 [archaeon]|nr:hypothetical protein [archaeon]